MVASLTRRLGTEPFNGVRARWIGHPYAWALIEKSVVSGSAIIGSISSELADLIIDLLQLQSIAGFLICQTMGNDLASVGVNLQMQFSPAAPGLYAMLPSGSLHCRS